MEPTKNIFTLKSEQKELAGKIRETKTECKKLQKAKDYAGILQYGILKLKKEYRHRHIAYSMLRGREYKEIEKTCRTKPNMNLIKAIMEEYKTERISQEVENVYNVRACA